MTLEDNLSGATPNDNTPVPPPDGPVTSEMVHSALVKLKASLSVEMIDAARPLNFDQAMAAHINAALLPLSPLEPNPLLEVLKRVVEQAFNPPPSRHKRSGFTGSACDITCQPCALEAARAAIAAEEARQTLPITPPDDDWKPTKAENPAYKCRQCGSDNVYYREINSDYGDIKYHCRGCDKTWIHEGADA